MKKVLSLLLVTAMLLTGSMTSLAAEPDSSAASGAQASEAARQETLTPAGSSSGQTENAAGAEPADKAGIQTGTAKSEGTDEAAQKSQPAGGAAESEADPGSSKESVPAEEDAQSEDSVPEAAEETAPARQYPTPEARSARVVPAAAAKPVLNYTAYVQDKAWLGESADGQTAGTVGEKRRMEAFKVRISGDSNLSVQYRSHVAEQGWESGYASNNGQSGTQHKARAIEAVQVKLAGSEAGKYDIFYRVQVAELGWLDWAANGETAGTTGFALRVEAIQIRLLPKGDASAPTNRAKPSYSQEGVCADVHIQNIGWQRGIWSENLGTTGRNLSMEALTLKLANSSGSGISYQAHVAGIGWQSGTANGGMAGTTHQSRAIEALRIKLTGNIAKYYNIYYRVHVAELGWLDWAVNDQEAGTTGFAYGVQALQIRVLPKKHPAPGPTTTPSAGPLNTTYSSSSWGIGWQAAKNNGQVSGTVGQNRPMELLRMKVSDLNNVGIQYETHVSDIGWTGYTGNNAESGRMGNGRQIEAVRVRLTGANAKFYNVWYRVHSANLGWLGWTSNGAAAGTTRLAYSAQAIQVLVLPKSRTAPGSTSRPYVDSLAGWTYVNGFRRWKNADGSLSTDVTGIFNPSSKRITVDRIKNIVTIYGYNSSNGSYDTPIKSMYCCVGNPISRTTPGTYRTGWKMLKKQMVGSNYVAWGSYVTQIYGAVYFHGCSSGSSDLSRVSKSNFEALGRPYSHGCVNLAATDARWIYYNCVGGTTVQVGDNMASPLPAIRYAWRGGSHAPDPTYY